MYKVEEEEDTKMNVVHRSKRAHKRNNKDEDKTSGKRRKIDEDFVEEEIKHVENKNIDSDDNSKTATSIYYIHNAWCDEFNGKSLRSLFSSSGGFHALKKFVTICKENKEKDLAAEYLLAGGSVLEILKLLGSSDRKNSTDVTIVFSAINILLMKYAYT